jgi:DNA-binding winged helix-turn-helix (wHTH) protein
MAEHPEVLVSKDELVRSVWGPIAVSDDALTRTVAELRRRLGDDAHTPRVIETVHRRGFRFIAELAAPQRSRAAERPSGRSRRRNTIDSAVDSAKPRRRES